MLARLFVHAVIILCLFTAGTVASANQCASLFTKSEWDQQLGKAYAHFSENLFNPKLSNFEFKDRRKTIYDGYNNYDFPHSRVLRDVFKIRLGRNGKAPSIEQMMDAYSKEISALVRSGKVSREDVLMPAFVFRVGSKYIWLKYGEQIPHGAKSEGDVLPDHIYNKMVSEGYFPVGNQFITPTRISSFEHDLAHLTAFLQYPQYMAQMRRLATKIVRGEIIPRDELDRRSYILGESLSLINESTKSEMFSHFLSPPGKSIYEVTHAEMTAYLKTLPPELIMGKLSILNQNYQRYFDNMGGSTRDFVNGSYNSLHVPYKVMIYDAISDMRHENRVETVASMQIIFIRLSETKLEDWFEGLDKVQLDKNSPLRKFFEDDAVWDIENGDLRESFYSSQFH